MIDCMACLALGEYVEWLGTLTTNGVTHGISMLSSRWVIPRCAFDGHGKPIKTNWFDDAFDIYANPTDPRYNPP